MNLKIKNIIYLSILTTLLCKFDSAHGTEYYVAKTGSDASGNGSISAPWATPEYGAKKLAAGDTLYVRVGTYQIATSNAIKSAAICPSVSGTSGSPITIAAYPGESVTLIGNNGNMPTNGVIGSYCGGSKSYLTIDGFTIQGIVVMEGGTGVKVQNCDISKGGDSWSGIGQGEVIWVEACTNCTIYNNRLHDNINLGAINDALIMAYTASNLTIKNNEFYNSHGDALYLKDSVVNSNIYYNYFHDNAYGGIWTANQGSPHDINIYQNIFSNNNTANDSEHGAITFVINTQNVNIYNNVFYKDYYSGFNKWTTSSMPATFFNNIIYNPRGNYLAWTYSSTTFNMTYLDYNNYYGGTSGWLYRSNKFSTLNQWQTYCRGTLGLSACEANSVDTTPNFLNGSGSFMTPSDFKRSSYPTNGRGGSYPSVMGAYVAGNETIGVIATGTTTINPPAVTVKSVSKP